MSNSWYVYILTNYTNTVLYIGVTNNLERRLKEHIRYKGDSFVKRYRLYKLVWVEEFCSPSQAIEIEKKIKGWIREKKLNLIRQKNPYMKNLLV